MGVREVVVLLVVAVSLGGVIALFLPRKLVTLKVKRIIACVWIALGLVEIVRGGSDSTLAGAWMAITGLSEVAMFGGALLLFADQRWPGDWRLRGIYRRRPPGGCRLIEK
jgi:hypothetical protein